MRDDEEIIQAMDRYGDAVLRSARAYLQNRHDADDVFQDTFVKFATTDTIFNDDDHQKAWLIRVAVNLCKDRVKSSASRTVELEEYDQPDAAPSGEYDTVDQRLVLQQALQKLPADNRTALVLSVVEGYTAIEIAQMMDKPVNTVYSLITRGREKMRKAIDHD